MGLKDKGRLSEDERKQAMAKVKEKFTQEWVAEEIKRKTYEAVVQKLQTPCAATLARVSSGR